MFFFKLFGGFRILHLGRLPKNGAVIIAPNHVSFADPPAIACSADRNLRFMAQAELFKPPIFRNIIRLLGSFPVKRGGADSQAIRMALEILGTGQALLIFPEGRRGDGKNLLPANKGVGLLASKSGAQIVPVGICNTNVRLRKGAKFPKRSLVTVVYGEPFTYQEIEEQFGREKAKSEFGKILMSKIAELMREGGQEINTASETVLKNSESRLAP